MRKLTVGHFCAELTNLVDFDGLRHAEVEATYHLISVFFTVQLHFFRVWNRFFFVCRENGAGKCSMVSGQPLDKVAQTVRKSSKCLSFVLALVRIMLD